MEGQTVNGRQGQMSEDLRKGQSWECRTHARVFSKVNSVWGKCSEILGMKIGVTGQKYIETRTQNNL